MDIKTSEDILSKLKMIASIEKGQTFSPSYDTPLDHNIWSTSIWRTYNREDRKKSINYIKNILEQAYQLYYINSDSKIIEMMSSALQGLDNLKVTYKGDFMIIGLVNTILEDYTKKINPVDTEYIELEFFTELKNMNYSFIENYLYEGYSTIVKNNELQNALHIVSDKKYYHCKIMDLLLNFNVGLTDKDIHGNSPLYYAVTSGCTEAVFKLEEAISKKKRALQV